MGYYEMYDYISNSTLKSFNDALRAKERPANIQDVFDFGNLLDASVTEKDKVRGNTLYEESGNRVVTFTDEQITKSNNMALVMESDPFFKVIFEGAKTQYVVLREAHTVRYDGVEANVKARCKFDILRRGVIGGDIKTTACTSQKSFVESIDHWDYDQQAAWYMDLARIDRFMFFGVSKSTVRGKHQLFKYAINRGDEMYTAGLNKYSRAAVLYYYTITTLDKKLITINI